MYKPFTTSLRFKSRKVARSFVLTVLSVVVLEQFPKRLNRGIPLRERIGFKVRAGMEASMDGETVFGGSACA
ncbi:MAG: hypothetical protein ABSF87_09250, partial [Xanthobacteraceae bacterium]